MVGIELKFARIRNFVTAQHQNHFVFTSDRFSTSSQQRQEHETDNFSLGLPGVFVKNIRYKTMRVSLYIYTNVKATGTDVFVSVIGNPAETRRELMKQFLVTRFPLYPRCGNAT